MNYEEQKFNLPEIQGLSKKNIEEHVKLYAGYVKHTNLVLEKIAEYSKDTTANGYAINEIRRRFGFEFGGMRNHEYYFGALEGGPVPLTSSSPLKKAIVTSFGDYDEWQKDFKSIALTRGIGWAILVYDKKAGRLLNSWVDEQHIGHLAGLPIVLALDMFEHAYYLDYVPAEKKIYIDDYFANVNWLAVEKFFEEAAE
jgi:Fe-Mn family superoxide dismutase